MAIQSQDFALDRKDLEEAFLRGGGTHFGFQDALIQEQTRNARERAHEPWELEELVLLQEFQFGSNGEHNIKILLINDETEVSAPFLDKAKGLVEDNYARWQAKPKGETVRENPLILVLLDDEIPVASANLMRVNGHILPSQRYFRAPSGEAFDFPPDHVYEIGNYAKNHDSRIPQGIKEIALATTMKGICLAGKRDLANKNIPQEEGFFIASTRNSLLKILNNDGLMFRHAPSIYNGDNPEVVELCTKYASYWAHPRYFTEPLIAQFRRMAEEYQQGDEGDSPQRTNITDTMDEAEGQRTEPHIAQSSSNGNGNGTGHTELLPEQVFIIGGKQVKLAEFLEAYKYLLKIKRSYEDGNQDIAEARVERVLVLYPWIDSLELLGVASIVIAKAVEQDLREGSFQPSSATMTISPQLPDFEAQIDAFLLEKFRKLSEARKDDEKREFTTSNPDAGRWENIIRNIVASGMQYIPPIEIAYQLNSPSTRGLIRFTSPNSQAMFMRAMAESRTDILELFIPVRVRDEFGERIIVFPPRDRFHKDILSRYLPFFGKEVIRAMAADLPLSEIIEANSEVLGPLTHARVGIAGTGTTGPAIADALTAMGTAALGQIIVAEVPDEEVEIHNTIRRAGDSVFNIGAPKPGQMTRRILQRNIYQDIKIYGKITKENVESFVASCEIVFSALDDMPAMLLLHQECLKQGKPLVLITDIGQAATTVDIYDYRLERRLFAGRISPVIYEHLNVPENKMKFIFGLLGHHIKAGNFPIETLEALVLMPEHGLKFFPQSGGAASGATENTEDLCLAIIPHIHKNRKKGKLTKFKGKSSYLHSAKRSRIGFLGSLGDKAQNIQGAMRMKRRSAA